MEGRVLDLAGHFWRLRPHIYFIMLHKPVQQPLSSELEHAEYVFNASAGEGVALTF